MATTKTAPSPKAVPTPKTKTSVAPKQTVVAPTKKKGIRAPQIRILTVLSKSKKPMARKEIAEKAPVDLPFCTEYLGSNDPEVRAKNDEKMFPSLITLGAIKFSNNEESGATMYEITAKGRQILETTIKEEKEAARAAVEVEKVKAAAAKEKASAKAKADADAAKAGSAAK